MTKGEEFVGEWVRYLEGESSRFGKDYTFHVFFPFDNICIFICAFFPFLFCHSFESNKRIN